MSSSFFSNIFGQRPGPDEPSASVLAEWNKYSGDTAGALSETTRLNTLEAAPTCTRSCTRSDTHQTCSLVHAAPSTSDRLASRMEEGGATVQTIMTGALARLSIGVQGVRQTVGAGVQT